MENNQNYWWGAHERKVESHIELGMLKGSALCVERGKKYTATFYSMKDGQRAAMPLILSVRCHMALLRKMHVGSALKMPTVSQ